VTTVDQSDIRGLVPHDLTPSRAFSL